MKSNKLIMAALAVGLTFTATSCRDDFAETNTNPSAVTKGEISYLFAEAVNKFDPQPYLEYFYNAPMKYQWAGMGMSASGAGEGILTLTLDARTAKHWMVTSLGSIKTYCVFSALWRTCTIHLMNLRRRNNLVT